VSSALAKFDARYPAPLLGVDEVGTGAIAGPVYAAGVVLPEDREVVRALCAAGLRDSKQMTSAGRENVARFMEENLVWCSIHSASVREIEELGQNFVLRRLFRAILDDARRGPCPKTVLVDGNPRSDIGKVTFMPKADSLSLAVAAASVIAKVTRDRVMRKLAEGFPAYGWEVNSGYPTARHLEALDLAGVSVHHRRYTKPVSAALRRLREEASGSPSRASSGA
jgi:ribonuclease HII